MRWGLWKHPAGLKEKPIKGWISSLWAIGPFHCNSLSLLAKQGTILPGTVFRCPVHGGLCYSRIGLFSHQRSHKTSCPQRHSPIARSHPIITGVPILVSPQSIGGDCQQGDSLSHRYRHHVHAHLITRKEKKRNRTNANASGAADALRPLATVDEEEKDRRSRQRTNTCLALVCLDFTCNVAFPTLFFSCLFYSLRPILVPSG